MHYRNDVRILLDIIELLWVLKEGRIGRNIFGRSRFGLKYNIA